MKYKNNNLNELQYIVDMYKLACNNAEKLTYKFKTLNLALNNYAKTEDQQLRQNIEYNMLRLVLKDVENLKHDKKLIMKHKINMFITSRNKFLNKLKYKNVRKYKYKPNRPKMY